MNYIFYHVSDLDGHCSGAETALFLRSNDEKYKMIPFNYGYEINKEQLIVDKDANLYLVDISFSPEDMLWVKQNCKKVTWIDHHISAIENSKRYDYEDLPGIRNTKHAACKLAYDYFQLKYNDRPIDYLSNWDIWNHEDMRTVYFQYAMRQFDTNPINDEIIDFWRGIISHKNSNRIPFLIKQGECIYNYEIRRYQILARNAYDIQFGKYKTICINSIEHNSKIFDSIPEIDTYDLKIVYNYNATKNVYRVSFYSANPNVDCSVIASSYGGGGHKGAAGCEMPNNYLFINYHA